MQQPEQLNCQNIPAAYLLSSAYHGSDTSRIRACCPFPYIWTNSFTNPDRVLCSITLTKNKYARLEKHYLNFSMDYAEYGKWSLRGDTVTIIFSSSECSLRVFTTDLKTLEPPIRKMKVPQVHKYLWRKDRLEDQDSPRQLPYVKTDPES